MPGKSKSEYYFTNNVIIIFTDVFEEKLHVKRMSTMKWKIEEWGLSLKKTGRSSVKRNYSKNFTQMKGLEKHQIKKKKELSWRRLHQKGPSIPISQEQPVNFVYLPGTWRIWTISATEIMHVILDEYYNIERHISGPVT